MRKFLVVGDIHGDIDGMYKYILAWQERTNVDIDGILHVGDFGIYTEPHDDFTAYWNDLKRVPIHTWVVPGNHEDHTVLAQWLNQPKRMRNLHLLRDGEVTDVLGVKVGAIWGNFSYKSWMNPDRILMARRNGHDSKKAMHILKPSVEKLKTAGEFDVLLTHDAPARLMKAMRQPPLEIKMALGLEYDEVAQGCPGFNELYETGKPTYHFFGHFHSYHICQVQGPTVIALHCFNYVPEQSIYSIEL